jgi:hypothetical protein
MPGQERLRVQAPAAFALQHQNSQGLLATSYHHSVLIRLQNLAGLTRTFDHLRPPNLKQVRLGLAA